MPASDLIGDVYTDSKGRRRRKPGRRNTFLQFMDSQGIPPLQAVPSDWCRGPFYLDLTLPTSAALTSVVTDDNLYGDPMLRSVFAPANGGTNVTQSVGFVVSGALLLVPDGNVNVLASTVLDDLLIADPTLEWAIGGVTRARSLVESIKLSIETANVLDSDLATATAYGRRFAAIPVPLPTMYVIPKSGDTMGVRTSANLTATVACRLKLYGAALPADVLQDIVGSSRQSQGGACNAGSGFGVDLGAEVPGIVLNQLEAGNMAYAESITNPYAA